MEDYEKIKSDFDLMIGGDTPVLVDFYATWCGPCKMMHPVLDDLKKQMGDSVHILKLDIDNKANIKVVQQFRIRSVPTFILFQLAVYKSNSATVSRYFFIINCQ